MENSQNELEHGTVTHEKIRILSAADRLVLFLLLMSGYSLLSLLGQRLLDTIVYQKISDFFMNRGMIANLTYFSTIYSAICNLIWQIPVVLYLLIQKEKVKKSTKENTWIFDVLVMIAVCMSALYPVALTVMVNSESNVLLKILTVALVVFVCACYENNATMKLTAGAYFGLAFVVMIVMFRVMGRVYLSSSIESLDFAIAYQNFLPIIYAIYVAAGYGIAGLLAMMNHRKKITEQE